MPASPALPSPATPYGHPTRRLAPLLTAALAAALTACASLAPTLPQPGQTEADARAALGTPTGRYAMPDGVQRLEFARGPYGRVTWMVDLDAGGRVLRSAQVLTPENFARVRPGMTRDELLRLLGRPADRQGEWQNRETWSWRFETYECEWLRVTLDANGYVRGGASRLPDPRCDADH